MSVTIKRVLVTPEMAAKWLDGHQNYRSMRRTYMLRLAADMRAGNFHDVADPIRFDSAGSLVDGQHRLSAIVESGVSISMLVAHGVDNVEVIDAGTPRNVGDTVRREMDIPNANSVVASLRRLHKAGYISIGEPGQPGNVAPTNSQIINYIGQHPELRRACLDAAPLRTRNGMVVVSDAICVLHLAQVFNLDYDLALTFLQSVSDGCDLKKGDPALALRDRLLSIKTSRNNDAAGFARLYIFLRALRAKIDGQSLVVIRYVHGETTLPKF
jgi:hypothetical protein